MSEARNKREGNLYVIPLSGSGNAWVTASGASAYNLAFVENFSFTSAQTIETIMNRGTPHHHKVVSLGAPTMQFTVLVANTAEFAPPVSGGGASVPMYGVEFKQSVPETADVTGIYATFWGVAQEQIQFSEVDRANTQQMSWRALGFTGWNNTGYIA